MKKSLKSLLVILFTGSFLFSCGTEKDKAAENSKTKKQLVGISMPTKSSQRWINDGASVVKSLEKMGYNTELQYAEDIIENQVSQIENMITKNVDILIIAPIDGSALTEVIGKAHDLNIKVIAYDRLITNTANIEYYATFDNFKVGVLQGQYIEKKLKLKEGKGPYNIEVFGGSPDDNNAYFFYDGALSILEPYINSGKLVIRSKQLGMDKTAILRWDGATAQNRMDNLLSTFYTDGKLDAVLSPYDGISIGIVSSLKSMGFGSGAKKMPVVTGQDAELASVKSILSNEQTQTILKDTSKLAQTAAEMVDAILTGKEVQINDTKTYNNGIKIVPSYLLEPISVDINNWKETLVDSGYYTSEQIIK